MQHKTILMTGLLAAISIALPQAISADQQASQRRGLKNQIQQDRKELRDSRQQLQSDRKELNEDRREYRQDRGAGASREELARDKTEIRESLDDLRDSRREVERDRRELNRDVRRYERRYDERERDGWWPSWW